MDFNKNDIITLSGGIKHIIVDILEYDNKYYYYVCEVDKEEQNVLGNNHIITTVRENGSIFVKTVKGELYDKLKLVFDDRLKNTY